MASTEEQLTRDLSAILGLHDTERQTMAAVLKRCSAYGLATGAGGAVYMAGAGAVAIPVLGSVPGWVAGFLAGFVGGTAVCTLAQRGVVIEALKKAASAHYGRSMSSDEAVAAIRTELFRARAHGLRNG